MSAPPHDPTKIDPRVAGKVPKHDLDAEAAVLSAALLDADAAAIAVANLKPSQCYSEAHGTILDVIGELVAEGKPVDIVTVATVLRDRDDLARVGGPAYLARIVDATPAVAHVAAHCKTVADLSRVRQLVSACQEVAAAGYGEIGDVGEFLASAARRIDVVTTEALPVTVHRLGSIVEEVFKQLGKPEEADVAALGVTSGTAVERFARKVPGDVTVIAARPGMGKSAFVLQDAIEASLCKQPGGEICASAVFSLEMPKSQLASRAIANFAGVDVSHVIQRAVRETDWPRIAQAVSVLHRAPVWVDETPAINLSQLRAGIRAVKRECAQLAKRQGRNIQLRYVAVDYLQLMSGPGGTPEQIVSNNTQGLKRLAKEEKLHIAALSQLNRAVETRDPPIPQMSDLRSSGAIEQDADNIIFLYRPEYYAERNELPVDDEDRGICEAHVAKVRNGATGMIRLRFYKSSTRFENLIQEGTPE
ncbi:MAG: replicative DNA helicase [Polyangiaceae bacterium]|nr:replicative DNA helicase [Polyangiaceae bacterium]